MGYLTVGDSKRAQQHNVISGSSRVCMYMYVNNKYITLHRRN
jgi:hypothetical protein